MSIAIKIENLSKQYRLGLVSTRTLSHDLNRWWQTSILGREDPYLKIGQENKLTTHNSKLTAHNSPEYVWALRDINLEVQEGEVLGIIGKNGAGKSTLLKILSKVTAPTTGTIKARGRIASLLEIGTGFHPEMTGRENIYMNGSIMGMTRSEITRKFDEIVDFAGVERYIDTPVKRYSSGMTVRLGFAIAAHLEPEILVVDEVLAVGDAEFQQKAIGKMQDVSKGQGRTVLFVSHNMASIRTLCKHGILLKDGTIFLNSDINIVIDTYLSRISNLKYEYCWNKNNPRVQNTTLESIQIVDSLNNPKNQIFSDQKFSIRITYKIEHQQIGGGFTIILYDEEGRCVFGSILNTDDSLYGKGIKSGLYYAKCEIPANLLNNKIFNVSLIMFSYKYSISKLIENVLRFEIMDSFAIRNDFTGKYEGNLRPKLKWENSKIV